MQASIGQYSIQAGEPEQPVQQSVVIARIRGRFLRAAFPSPSDIGQCLSTMSYIQIVLRELNLSPIAKCRLLINLGEDLNQQSAINNLQCVDSNIALRISSTICVSTTTSLLRRSTGVTSDVNKRLAGGYEHGDSNGCISIEKTSGSSG